MVDGCGYFVSLDGPSGVGKTTVSALLVGKLRTLGINAVLTATPSKSAIGELARSSTFDFHGRALTCLVAADRHHHDEVTVRPGISKGVSIVCDRYVASSFVLDVRDGVPPEFLRSVYDGLTVPDVSFFLFGNPGVCMERAAARGQYSRFHYVDVDEAVAELRAFEVAADALSAIGYPVHRYDIADTTADQVVDALLPVVLSAKENGP
jgi:dTMP kinase